MSHIYSKRPASAAALFTNNTVTAAPVIVGRERIKQGLCQAVIVNSGNANCFTGKQGINDAVKTAALAAGVLEIPEALVMMSSTGVIGAPLPMDVLESGIPELVKQMSPDGLNDFSQAILTTDTTSKVSTGTGTIKEIEFTVTGIAKGSGMIRPDMATMLAFICTDLDISSSVLTTCLKKACDRSFNRITVDGDTSTNDTVLAIANGLSHAALEDSDDSLVFQKILDRVMLDLARMVVRDGEGATKLARIVVKGALSPDDAFKACEAVAHSNLVKTALYGEDPNWGRIIAAAGRSGAVLDPEKLDLLFEDVVLVKGGSWLGKDAEKKAAEVMKKDEMEIILDLNLGRFTDSFLFCDFSEDYVKINADYRS